MTDEKTNYLAQVHSRVTRLFNADSESLATVLDVFEDDLSRFICEGNEVYEMYVVTGWLASRLELDGKKVLHTCIGPVWGRTRTGMTISEEELGGKS